MLMTNQVHFKSVSAISFLTNIKICKTEILQKITLTLWRCKLIMKIESNTTDKTRNVQEINSKDTIWRCILSDRPAKEASPVFCITDIIISSTTILILIRMDWGEIW